MVGHVVFVSRPLLLLLVWVITERLLLAQEYELSEETINMAADGSITPHDGDASALRITGGVVMSDGTSLPCDLSVQLICHGQVLDESPISPRGSFMLEIGLNNFAGARLDTSVQGHPNFPTVGEWPKPTRGSGSSTALSSCEVRLANPPGYSSQKVVLGNLDRRIDSDVGTIVLYRSSASNVVSEVTVPDLMVPKKTRKLFEKAKKELSKEAADLSKARRYLEQVLKEYPEFTEAWYLLGRCRKNDDELQSATEAFQKAVQLDSHYAAAYLELARCELSAQHWEEASHVTQRLVKLQPGNTQVLYFDGIAHYYTGQFERAEDSLLKILAQEGSSASYPIIFFYLAVINSYKQSYSVAADYFRTFLEVAPGESVPESLKLDVQSQLKMWQDRGVLDE